MESNSHFSDDNCWKTLTSIFRQNEQHKQIKTMANNGPFCKRIKMINKTSSNQSCGRDRECKMERFKSLSVCVVLKVIHRWQKHTQLPCILTSKATRIVVAPHIWRHFPGRLYCNVKLLVIISRVGWLQQPEIKDGSMTWEAS